MTSRDLQISGWLDGSLPAGEASLFEQELERDPTLAEQVATWQENDELLRTAFNAPIEQGVDDALLARMGLSAPDIADRLADPLALALARPAAVSRVGANDNPSWLRWALPAGSAVAAGIAIAVMLAGNPSPNSPDGTATAQFAEAMERLPSRSEQAMADGGRISPVLSFAAADGRYCREFAVTGGTQPGGGIACKGDAGWNIEARSAVGAEQSGQGEIVAASGADGSELDAAYERLGAADPLSGEAERALLANGWKQ